MTIKLSDFFTYFKSTPNQQEAVKLLEDAMPQSLLQDGSAWVLKYREAEPVPEVIPSAIPQQGVDLCHEFEGCRLAPYRCPAGVPTVGWGNTKYENGTAVKLSDPAITQERADTLFVNISEKSFWNVIKRTVPFFDQMNANQQSAIFDFSYNLGAYFFNSPGFNTISRVLERKEWNKVPDALMLYINPGTAYEAGLRRRREAEGQLWMKPI